MQHGYLTLLTIPSLAKSGVGTETTSHHLAAESAASAWPLLGAGGSVLASHHGFHAAVQIFLALEIDFSEVPEPNRMFTIVRWSRA
jgi:hypothetical protein